MRRIISKVLSVTLTVVIVLAAAVMLLVGYNTKTGKATVVMGYSFMAVQTGSMAPKYPVGSVVIVKVCDSSELKIGDVISFYSSDPAIMGRIVTHRINNIVKDDSGRVSFEMKGDANVIVDKYYVEGRDVVGKVVGRSAILEKAVQVRNNQTAFFLIIVIPICVAITFEIISISKRMNSDEKSEEKNDKKKQ